MSKHILDYKAPQVSVEDAKRKVSRLQGIRDDVDRRYKSLDLDDNGHIEVRVNDRLTIRPEEDGYESMELRFLADVYGNEDSWRVKRTVRYWFYRFRSQITAPETDMSDLPDEAWELKDSAESQPWFKEVGGWAAFAVRWDVDWSDPVDMTKIKYRRRSVWKEWERDLAAQVPVLPRG